MHRDEKQLLIILVVVVAFIIGGGCLGSYLTQPKRPKVERLVFEYQNNGVYIMYDKETGKKYYYSYHGGFLEIKDEK